MAFEEQLRQTLDRAIAGIAAAARADRERAREEGLSGGADRLLEGVRAIGRAGTLGETLDALAESAGREASRAAVFLLRDGELRGRRFVGFGERFAEPQSVALELEDSGVMAEAVASRAPAASGRPPAFAERAGSAGPAVSFAMPVEIAGEVVAVLYADDRPDGAHEGRAASRALLEIMARHASRTLEAIVALKAAHLLARPEDSDAPGLPPAAPGSDTSDRDDGEAAARRYARLLVSEIKLYHEPAVVAGRRDGDLATRLGAEIARARSLYEQRVPAAIRQRADHFHDELVRTLADGDPSLLHLT